jgi:hypothetical protein
MINAVSDRGGPGGVLIGSPRVSCGVPCRVLQIHSANAARDGGGHADRDQPRRFDGAEASNGVGLFVVVTTHHMACPEPLVYATTRRLRRSPCTFALAYVRVLGSCRLCSPTRSPVPGVSPSTCPTFESSSMPDGGQPALVSNSAPITALAKIPQAMTSSDRAERRPPRRRLRRARSCPAWAFMPAMQPMGHPRREAAIVRSVAAEIVDDLAQDVRPHSPRGVPSSWAVPCRPGDALPSPCAVLMVVTET